MPSPIPGLDVHELSNVDIPKSYAPPKVEPSTGGYAGRTPGPGLGPAAAGAAPTAPTNPQAGWFKRTADTLRTGASAAKEFVSNPGASNPLRAAANVGFDLASGAGRLLRSPLLRAYGAGAAVGGALDGLKTDTEIYARRFGLEDTEPGLARDLGVRSLGVLSDVANNALFGLPKQVLDYDKPAPFAPTAAGPTLRLQNPGRGFGFDDPRRLDMDPSRGSLRESRDFGPELASVPAQLPDTRFRRAQRRISS